MAKPANDADGVEEPDDAALSALNRARAAASARGDRRVRSAAASQASTRSADARNRRRSSDRRGGRDPLEVGDVFSRMVNDRGWSTPVSIGSVMDRWPQIVGEDIAAHCAAKAFRETTLHVVCDSTAWATQVRLMVPTLLARFDEEIGAGILTAIKVSGPAAPSWKRGGWNVDGRGPRDTYG